MLEVVFDRLVRMMTTSLRNFTSENVEISLEGITSLRFGDYLDTVPLPAMIAVFRAVEWDNYGLLTVSSPLIYAIVDVLLGGRRGLSPIRLDGRPFTTIERALVERLIRLVLSEMGNAFAPLSAVEFRHERLETNPRFATIARPTNAAVLFKLHIEIDNRGGPLEVLIPYATLEPVRDLLLQMFMGEKFGRDTIWESHLARQILVTAIELEALLEEQTIPLGRGDGAQGRHHAAAVGDARHAGAAALRPRAAAARPHRPGRRQRRDPHRGQGRSPGGGAPVLTLIVDGLLAVLLLAALALGLRLQRSLHRLRHDDGEIGRLIEALDTATSRSASALEGCGRPPTPPPSGWPSSSPAPSACSTICASSAAAASSSPTASSSRSAGAGRRRAPTPLAPTPMPAPPQAGRAAELERTLEALR